MNCLPLDSRVGRRWLAPSQSAHFRFFASYRATAMNRSAASRPRPMHYWRWLVVAACIITDCP